MNQHFFDPTRHRGPRNTPWTVGDAILMEMWPTNKFSREIAEELKAKFGIVVSLNAIYRRGQRLRLGKRDVFAGRPKKERPRSEPRPPREPHQAYVSPWILGDRRLRQLWEEGRPASECASILTAELGYPITRNAVIGRVHRSGLPPRIILSRPRYPKTLDPLRIALSKARRAAAQRERYAKAKEEKRKNAPEVIDAQIPQEQRRSIYEIERHECHWPVGDPASENFFFCGAEVEKDKPYCSSHCARAFYTRRVA